MIFLVPVALLCLLDTLFVFRFKTRLRFSQRVAFTDPQSFLSSSYQVLVPLFLASLLLVWKPILTLFPIFFTKWPHPLFNIFKEIKQKKIKPILNGSSRKIEGEKLFSIRVDDKPHIIFLFLESFRAKNVGALGAKNPMSPHFDQLVKEGILFTNFHASGNLTSRSIIASTLGLVPAFQPWHLNEYANLKTESTFDWMKTVGYKTALIQGSSKTFDHTAVFFEKKGADVILSKSEIEKPGTSWGVFDEYLMEKAANWLEDQTSPTFLNLYTITNHHPWIGPNERKGFYDTFSYTDEALGLLINLLEKKKLLEKSILFITADHGQELIDRGKGFVINQNLFQDTLHIPLLIYAKGRIDAPGQIDTLSSHVDLFATLKDLFGENVHQTHGKSLLRSGSSPIFFNHPFDEKICGARFGKKKILLQKKKAFSFDLEKDPDELFPIKNLDPALVDLTKDFYRSLEEFYFEKPVEIKPSSSIFSFKDRLDMTDEKLEEILEKNHRLSSLFLHHCLLLTDVGIQRVLEKLHSLESLELVGLEISKLPQNMKNLISLHIENCPNFQTKTLFSELKILKLMDLDLGDEDLLHLSKTQKDLSALFLHDIEKISEEGLISLIHSNPYLSVLSIQNCPLIRQKFFDSIKSPLLRYKSYG